MVLRRKPDVLINLLPKLSENSKYQGQDKLPVVIWMIVQVSCYILTHLKNDVVSVSCDSVFHAEMTLLCRQAK